MSDSIVVDTYNTFIAPRPDVDMTHKELMLLIGGFTYDLLSFNLIWDKIKSRHGDEYDAMYKKAKENIYDNISAIAEATTSSPLEL